MNEPTRLIAATTTVTAGPYAVGAAVGGVLEWMIMKEAGTRGGILQTVLVTLDAVAAPALDLILFSGPFTGTANGVAFNPPLADLTGQSLGHVKVTANDWSQFAANSLGSVDGIGKVLKSTPPGIVRGQLVCRSAFTPGSTSGMYVYLGVMLD